jgi:ankyrin repeat protein
LWYVQRELLNPSHALTPISATNGLTSLHIASLNGQLEVMKFLGEKGADINVHGLSSRNF